MARGAASSASDAHRPYVTKYVLVTDHWVVRCNCGLNEEHNDEASANARASEHKESGS